MSERDFQYSHGDAGRSYLMVANLPMNKGHKRARRVALKIYRWHRKQYYRPLIHKGKGWRG